jgi:hypothetical protein
VVHGSRGHSASFRKLIEQRRTRQQERNDAGNNQENEVSVLLL